MLSALPSSLMRGIGSAVSPPTWPSSSLSSESSPPSAILMYTASSCTSSSWTSTPASHSSSLAPRPFLISSSLIYSSLIYSSLINSSFISSSAQSAATITRQRWPRPPRYLRLPRYMLP